jgi:hypothetical protein
MSETPTAAARAWCFVGERHSPTAAARGWAWEDGRVCAATLHRALHAAGIEPAACRYLNLWQAPGLGRPPEPPALGPVWALHAQGYTIVALGTLVHAALLRACIPHHVLRHPAARGAGRATAVYHAHVRHVLAKEEAS